MVNTQSAIHLGICIIYSSLNTFVDLQTNVYFERKFGEQQGSLGDTKYMGNLQGS